MKLNCPNPKCSLPTNPSLPSRPIVRNGSFYRKSDSRWIGRFFCKNCKKYFSRSTSTPAYFQKQRRITHPLYKLMCSGVSQRRAARILRVDPKTVVRRFRFLAKQKRILNDEFLKNQYQNAPLQFVQFDDLETSEHTKCKPLSVALAVDPLTRKILNYQVSQMPAKGLLAHKARKKYGLRPDQRGSGWKQLMKALKPYVSEEAVWTSDENPHYPKFLRKHYPHSKHIQVKGGRGAIIGQGELKKLRFDPIFALNHACAMLRANLNRLFRKTWCTTKTKRGLLDHLALYVYFHNSVLTLKSAGLGGS